MGEVTEQDEKVEGAEADGGKAEDEKFEEIELEGELLTPDQFDLARLFAGPNSFTNVSLQQHLKHWDLVTKAITDHYLFFELRNTDCRANSIA